MERTEVAVRRPQHVGERIRVGTVLSRVGARAKVRWNDDGSVEENVQLGNRDLLAVEGTLRHQALADPVALAYRFGSDPIAVILELLRENSRALRASAIKEQLIAFGLEKEVVDKAWRSAYTKLTNRDDVQVKSKTYKWTETADSTSEPARSEVRPRATEVVAEEIPSGPIEATEHVNNRNEPTPSAGIEKSEPSPAGDPESEPAAEAEQPTVGTPTASPSSRPLTEVLPELLGERSPQPLQRFIATPLKTGTLINRLDESAVDHLLSTLDEQDRQVVTTLLLAVPRKSRVVDAPEHLTQLDPALVSAVLTAAATELREQGASSPAIRTAAAWLLRRVSASTALRVAISPYVEVAVHVAEDPQKVVLDALGTVSQTLSRVLPDIQPDVLDLNVLAQIVQRLPFSAHGGRVALMTVVGQKWPEIIATDRWWNGATVQGLRECDQGAFRAVLRSASVIEGIVRPLMEGELAAVTTRARLSLFVGLPSGLVEHLPPSAVAEALRRIGGQDPVAAAWAEELSGKDRLERLRDELRKAREESATAIELAEAAELRVRELAERCAGLEQDLQDLRTQEIRVRTAQKRQLQIDVVRALADLAAEVEELAVGGTAAEVVVERVRGLVAMHSLKPVGEVNKESAFDRNLHNPIFGAPAPGARVTVLRPGYIWASPDEDVLLHRALVDPVQPQNEEGG